MLIDRCKTLFFCHKTGGHILSTLPLSYELDDRDKRMHTALSRHCQQGHWFKKNGVVISGRLMLGSDGGDMRMTRSNRKPVQQET